RRGNGGRSEESGRGGAGVASGALRVRPRRAGRVGGSAGGPQFFDLLIATAVHLDRGGHGAISAPVRGAGRGARRPRQGRAGRQHLREQGGPGQGQLRARGGGGQARQVQGANPGVAQGSPPV